MFIGRHPVDVGVMLGVTLGVGVGELGVHGVPLTFVQLQAPVYKIHPAPPSPFKQ